MTMSVPEVAERALDLLAMPDERRSAKEYIIIVTIREKEIAFGTSFLCDTSRSIA